MSALEKFKRRLVRDIARRLYTEGQPEEEMWEQLKTEYGCDCFLLWQHMKVLTSKKLKRMLAAEDRMECITRVARMTSTDWLTFDLVLVHQDVDVIGEEMIQDGKPESPVLRHLFDLVTKYDVECISHDNLMANWAALTHYYNTGGRACSSMLLQRRWYQLKDLTRRRFYDFWRCYRGNPKNLEKSIKPTKLQFLIADSYPHIITERFVQWKDLIDMGKIVQAFQFESRKRKIESNVINTDNDPDLVVIEPHVETIELAADSDSEVEQVAGEKTEIQSKDSKLPEKSNVVTIKQKDNEVLTIDDSDKLEDLNKTKDTKKLCPKISVKLEPAESNKKILTIVKIEGNVNTSRHDDEEIKKDNTEIDVSEKQTDANNSMIETELVLPKITCVMGNVDIHDSQNITESNQENNQEIDEEQTDLKTEPQIVTTSSNTNLSKSVTEDIKETSKLLFDSDVINLNELPPTLEFVDDGIELLDSDDDLKEPEADNDNKIKGVEEVEATCKIDKKLVMFPITYTKKLDDMDIFKETDNFTVKGNDIIQCVEAASRSKLNTVETIGHDEKNEVGRVKVEEDRAGSVKVEKDKAGSVKIEEDKTGSAKIEEDKAGSGKVEEDKAGNGKVEGDKAGSGKVEEDKAGSGKVEEDKAGRDKVEEDKAGSDEVEDKSQVPRVKYTSWLLQKPKNRNYNPIILCKNPDFNTRLKRLSAVFFLCERNRRLFNACKPLTVDIHKAFETKLVNNVLYLENTTIPNLKQEKLNDVNTATVIPSAVAVQSLLDKTKEDDKDLLPQNVEAEEPQIVSNEKVLQRGEFVNVPECRANENLLTVEVSPISTKNKHLDNKPPVQLVEPARNAPQITTSVTSCNTKRIKWNTIDAELAKARRLQKNYTPWKSRPVTAAPQWSNLHSHPPLAEESLITKDTLDRVLALLDSGVFPKSKKKSTHTIADFVKTGTKDKNKEEENNTENDDISPNLKTDNDKVIMVRRKSYTRNNHLTTVGGAPKKRKRENTRTISKTSSFCCWARHKIAILTTIPNKNVVLKKFRHLCPLSQNACFCCCREKLLRLVDPLDKTRVFDHTYTVEIGPQQTLRMRRDVSIQAQCSEQEECNQSEIESTVEFFPLQYTVLSDDHEQTAIDSTPGKKNTDAFQQVTQQPSTNILTSSCTASVEQSEISSNSDDELQIDTDSNDESPSTWSRRPASSTPNLLSGDKTLTTFVAASRPQLKTKTISEISYCRVSSEPIPEVTVTPDVPSLNTTNNTETIVETISLLDDDTENPTEEIPQPSSNTLLPQGVHLLLLPDNTLTVSIENGVIIDPTSLSKLPDILAAVQKKLLESGLIKVSPEKERKKALNKNKVINIATENTELNDPSTINSNPELNNVNDNPVNNVADSELIVTQEYAENNIMDSEIQIIQENVKDPTLNVHQDDAVLNVINPEVNVHQENVEVNVVNTELNVKRDAAEFSDSTSDLGQSVAKTDPVLDVAESNAVPEVTSVKQNVQKNNREDKITHTDYIVKVAPETNRKTILSDLMTMSGISPEDANTPVEGTSNGSNDQNSSNHTNYASYTQSVADNTQTIQATKKIKKVMVFIKKKTNDVQQNPVIDLTEDNEKPEEDSKGNSLPINSQPPRFVYRKSGNFKNPKLVRIPASAVPIKVYKAAQSLLKKDVANNENIEEIDKQMKIQIAKRYSQINKKPTILDILHNLKATKHLTVRKKLHSESDSSDDEPLAKKSRRMHNNSMDNNDSVKIVPVSQYSLPVEYSGTMDTAPMDTVSMDTAPMDTAPMDTVPMDTTPMDTEEQNVTTTADTVECSILGI